MKNKEAGYLTVYLTLIMTLILSLCLALIEGARYQAIKLETECVLDIGLYSIMAEYHRELFEQYNIFAIDSSYGTKLPTKENTQQHLQDYMARNFSTEDVFLSSVFYKDLLGIQLQDVEVTRVSLLTDQGGLPFRKQGVEAVKDDVGIAYFEELLTWMEQVEINQLNTTDIAAQKRKIDEEINQYNGQEIQIKEGVWTTIDLDNPTDDTEIYRTRGALFSVVDDVSSLSMKSIQQEHLIMSRMENGRCSQGNILYESDLPGDKLMEHLLFQEYLMRYMRHYGEEGGQALSYQIEYIIAGHNSDVENLKGVADAISFVREAANAIHIFKDEEKCAEAELVALIICSLFEVPKLKELMKIAVILAWAYIESLHDVEILLEGGRVPLLKSRDTWYYSLENALKGFQKNTTPSKGSGLSYTDYLRIMLMLMDVNTLTGRAMNLVEADIRLSPGNSAFRMDGCYCSVEAYAKVKSKYGYEQEATNLICY